MTATVEKETGMLDAGTHCSFCRQLDFLPFHCKYCEGDFCASHRSKESHHCRWLIENEQRAQPVETKVVDNDGKYFQTLLPEKGYIRVRQVDTKKETSNVRPKGSKSALDKLARFFKKKDSINRSKPKSSKPNAFIELTKLKKNAIGDDKIPVTNRVYVYCYKIDDNENDSTAYEIYINKLWPLGRALDSIAQRLNVSNHNVDINVTSREKLYLYKKDQHQGDLQLLEPSTRVAAEIRDLDTLYLVRGDDTL
ncbi:hypothetical protein HG537_0H03830 [Torulaspora globosa]|uniref:AN1-type domain-containing protein n=1 Tax=Torulaspora globosa TaxID=48254 RepID=A0A7H9HYW0_9SACH|nr:hypothetical protein HG537_0H03830 [Torulaspora sp. CBS 2947]